MAIVYKPHNIDKLHVIDASSVNADFDKLYGEVNGGLDSANIANTYSFNASQAKLSSGSTFFSACEIENALSTLKSVSTQVRGYNSIQTISWGRTAAYIIIKKGRCVIKGNTYVVTADIKLDNSTFWSSINFLWTGTLVSSCGDYCVIAIKEKASATNPISVNSADIYVIQQNIFSQTDINSFVASEGGYYHLYSSTAAYRGLSVVHFEDCAVAGQRNINDICHLTRNSINESIRLTPCQVLSFYMVNVASNSGTGREDWYDGLSFSRPDSSTPYSSLVYGARRFINSNGEYSYRFKFINNAVSSSILIGTLQGTIKQSHRMSMGDTRIRVHNSALSSFTVTGYYNTEYESYPYTTDANVYAMALQDWAFTNGFFYVTQNTSTEKEKLVYFDVKIEEGL